MPEVADLLKLPILSKIKKADHSKEQKAEKPKSLFENIANKLKKRASAGKPADLLILDVDGTVYVRSRNGPYIGKNQETARNIREKNLPLLLNTARPIWDEQEDANFLMFGLTLPDAVMAGDGTMVFWRQKDGTLVADQAYADRIKQHKIIIKRNGQSMTTQFDPKLVQYAAMPLLKEHIESGMLVDSIIDQGPVLPDGTFGLEGLRLVARRMPYEKVVQLSNELGKYVSGVKLQMSEITEQTSAELFTGWLHIVPSIAGKNEAVKYVLSQLKVSVPDNLQAHVFGDTSVDIHQIAMGSDPQKDGYTVHGYAVGNLPERTRDKLTKVAESLSTPKANQLDKKAHLTLLEQPGPDAINHVVNSLS